MHMHSISNNQADQYSSSLHLLDDRADAIEIKLEALATCGLSPSELVMQIRKLPPSFETSTAMLVQVHRFKDISYAICIFSMRHLSTQGGGDAHLLRMGAWQLISARQRNHQASSGAHSRGWRSLVRLICRWVAAGWDYPPLEQQRVMKVLL